jgi:small GTP-binding protein
MSQIRTQTQKRISVGLVAHVDAGKTTTIESMMFLSGQIRKAGRVDHQDAFLDYDSQERDRGITIYSKQASFSWKDTLIQLLDTPGHVDFSSEMERVLSVLDLAVLVINGTDGVQSHTKTIWKCLEHYQVPVMIFVNKMDISFHDKQTLLEDLQKQISPSILTLDQDQESIAMASDALLDIYMEQGALSDENLSMAIAKRQLFPCFFGSALKMEGVEQLMDSLDRYSLNKVYPQEFGARVFKISQDENGKPMAQIKITGGSLAVRTVLENEEKVDQIRFYNGTKYELLQEACAGQIVSLKGPEKLEAGQGLGFENDLEGMLLNPYMNYEMILPAGVDALTMVPVFNQLMQSDPSLQIHYNSSNNKVSLQLMGAIQMEILQNKIEKLSNVKVSFSPGSILYQETISSSIKGYGHFEPLRHYAEVHLRLDPLPRGSGIQTASEVSMDDLALNWQRLILSHVQERRHKGVLTGAALTDVKITLIAGRASNKHTEGGDFRQATYRAIRQGLRKAECLLLEPYMNYTLIIDSSALSRAMYDLEQKHCSMQVSPNEDGTMTLTGKGPLRLLASYSMEVAAYTKGLGRFSSSYAGYDICMDQEEQVAKSGYDPDLDMANPCGSVFCTHGSGYGVEWFEVEENLHISPVTQTDSRSYSRVRFNVSDELVKKAFAQSGGQNANPKKAEPKPKKKPKAIDFTKSGKVEIQPAKKTCLIVDGYNMIYDWPDLKAIARHDLFGAREELIHILLNYCGYKGYELILVFDGYKNRENVPGNMVGKNSTIVYTRYGQSADAYIEKKVAEIKNDYHILVATSDGLIQNSILSHGATRLSARELEGKVRQISKPQKQVF